MPAYTQTAMKTQEYIYDQGDPSDHFTNADMTQTDHDNHEASVLGQLNPEAAWVLTDRDVWHHNPNYEGPAQPHPEDPIWELSGEEFEAALAFFCNPRKKVAFSMVPVSLIPDSCPF